MESLRTNVNQASSDFRSVKEAIVEKGVAIEDGAKTSEYANYVRVLYFVQRAER